MKQFLVEFSVIVILFLILKIFWSPKVKYWLGNFVIAINAFVCFLYLYGIYINKIPHADGFSKILLHSIVAIIIHTLFTLDLSLIHI